ncbi:MAG: hydroxymethylglutaryl-CoA lyase [Bacteroidetes bacterium]|nr:hydroxymethylglutaryl-CoA lyase [Bacteroidota bacterium]
MIESLQIVECPRDAMQGIKGFIPTEVKIDYLRRLLACGFHTLDCGSFVNPSAVPQMADTAEVLTRIGEFKGDTKLLVIVANERGAARAIAYNMVNYLGYPFSVNETFQRRNTNSTTTDAFIRMRKIHELASIAGKELVVYISMAFGNPYGENYDRDEVIRWADRIVKEGITTISLADTVGQAKTDDIRYLFETLSRKHPGVVFGAHFHARPDAWQNKVKAAWEAGCRRFDSAILGFGGCPFANDELTGNIPTEGLLAWINTHTASNINAEAFSNALKRASGAYHGQ